MRSGGGTSYAQMKHAQEALTMLQQRIYDHRLATSDVTILVVACYAMITALVSSEPEASRKHMAGLYKMVELRGGVRAFKHNGQVRVKLCRYMLALHPGASEKYISADITQSRSLRSNAHRWDAHVIFRQ